VKPEAKADLMNHLRAFAAFPKQHPVLAGLTLGLLLGRLSQAVFG
jgi:hypothetical protein